VKLWAGLFHVVAVSAVLHIFVGCAFIRKYVFPEGLAKELPKIGLTGGQNLS